MSTLNAAVTLNEVAGTVNRVAGDLLYTAFGLLGFAGALQITAWVARSRDPSLGGPPGKTAQDVQLVQGVLSQMQHDLTSGVVGLERQQRQLAEARALLALDAEQVTALTQR